MTEAIANYGDEYAGIEGVLLASLDLSDEAVGHAKDQDRDPSGPTGLVPWTLMSEIGRETKHARAAIATGDYETATTHTIKAAVLVGRLMSRMSSSH